MTNPTMVTDRTASAGVARRPLAGRLRYAVCGIVAAIALMLDQATKLIAVRTLPDNRIVDSGLPGLEWHLVGNEHAAFGIQGLFTGMFVVVTIVVVALVLRALPRTDRLSMALAYGLVVGGALGNVVDRLFREPGFPDGAVVDFIKIGWWPTFNLADTAIVSGAALIVLLLLVADREARQREREAADRESVRPGTVEPQSGARSGAVGGPPGWAGGPVRGEGLGAGSGADGGGGGARDAEAGDGGEPRPTAQRR